MLRILLTGKDGQVGWELQRTLAPLGDIVAIGRQEVDLADPAALRAVVRQIKPELIINAAAYTNVDQAEEERELAMAVNGVAPGVLAEEARRLDAPIIHYSTDYVFDGRKAGAYAEEDAAAPLCHYGITKLAGEEAIRASAADHLIFRTSWVYGRRGRNFLNTLLRLAREGQPLRVVADQYGAPTWSRLVAEATALAVAKQFSPAWNSRRNGTYHLTCAGRTSWHGFAQAILDWAQQGLPEAAPITTAEYLLLARRPANSVLANARIESAFGLRLPDWKAALEACLEEAG